MLVLMLVFDGGSLMPYTLDLQSLENQLAALKTRLETEQKQVKLRDFLLPFYAMQYSSNSWPFFAVWACQQAARAVEQTKERITTLTHRVETLTTENQELVKSVQKYQVSWLLTGFWLLHPLLRHPRV